MKDFGYPPTQKRPFTVSRIGAAPTWPPAPRAVLRPSAPPMFGDTNVAPAPAQAGPPYGQRERLGITNAAQQIPEKFGGGRGIRTPKGPAPRWISRDRKSTRLNSSHSQISYAVFCLKKKRNGTRDSARAVHLTLQSIHRR